MSKKSGQSQTFLVLGKKKVFYMVFFGEKFVIFHNIYNLQVRSIH